MDPLTAIGLASAVISFVDLGAKIAKRVEELSKAGDLPGVFGDIKTRIPLIMSIVKRIEGSREALAPDTNAAFDSVIENCNHQIKQLEAILNKVKVAPGDSTLKKGYIALSSLVLEMRVQRISATLKDNFQILTTFKVTHTEERRPSIFGSSIISSPGKYTDSQAVFAVPFVRDASFVGREGPLTEIEDLFNRGGEVAVVGVGGVGKSQVLIEYAYRYHESHPDAHVLWVYGGTIPRFYQGFKKIAQCLKLSGWDDPDVSILDITAKWFNETNEQYLLILDNADDLMFYWPNKFKGDAKSDPSKIDLSLYLPNSRPNGQTLISTRDNRIASRLTGQTKPVFLQSMNVEESKALFLSDLCSNASHSTDSEITELVQALDCLPLAITQAASFISENDSSISEYLEKIRGDDPEEFLDEEQNDTRRDKDSLNSVFKTWKLSFDQISKERPRAAEILCLVSLLDRQSIPKRIIKMPETVTSLGVLKSLNLISSPTGPDTLQLHRLCQRFVRLWLKRAGDLEKWQDAALACISQAYPTEIGIQQWPIGDALAPHVDMVLGYKYTSKAAILDLAHLFCWSSDFDVERGLYEQALTRAKQSLELYKNLVPDDDPRLAAAMWEYGRVQFYEARSTSDIFLAKQTLIDSNHISSPTSLDHAESAFELAHLFFDLGNEADCLKMGKRSFETWEAIEGIGSSRTLDNMHDYSLQLAMLGQVDEAVSNWQKILELCPQTNASERTKSIYHYRSMASIAEFQGDAQMAEFLYSELVELGTAIYGSEHVHVLDYRLSHAEQILRQNRPKQTIELCQSIIESSQNKSEWKVIAICYQMMAESCRADGNEQGEEDWRLKGIIHYAQRLGINRWETLHVYMADIKCFLRRGKYSEAENILLSFLQSREEEANEDEQQIIQALELLGICKLHMEQDGKAETYLRRAVDHPRFSNARHQYNLCVVLWNLNKWTKLQARCRALLANDSEYRSRCQQMLIVCLEEQAELEEAASIRAAVEDDMHTAIRKGSRMQPQNPPLDATFPPRFGRIIHPRVWSA